MLRSTEMIRLAIVCMRVYVVIKPLYLSLVMKSLFSHTWFSQVVNSVDVVMRVSFYEESSNT